MDEKIHLLPKLKAIPPTNEAFKENSKRAHFQACIWKAALDEEPPNLDPLKFGWVKDDRAKSLGAIPLPLGVPLAPAEVFKTIQCTCSSDQLSDVDVFQFSFLAPYSGSDRCFNQMTKEKDAVDAEEFSGDEDYRDEEDN